MSAEDFPFWSGRRRRSPFRSWFFGDFDEMMKDMEELFSRQFDEFSKRVPEELTRERDLPGGGKVKEWGPFIYGYSMTIGPDGKPQIREFGNLRPASKPGIKGLDVKQEREPLVDVFDSGGEIRVVAELPGVEKPDINLSANTNSLTISVDTPNRKYYKEIDLPAEVNGKEAKSSYKNGILEVSLPKISGKKGPKGEPIKIE